MQKFDFWYFDIFMFWGLLNSFMLFLRWYMWMNTIPSKWWVWCSSNLVCILFFTVLYIVLILGNLVLTVFYRSTKNYSYILRPMESNPLKCSSIQMVHSTELKFGTCIIGHHLIYCVEFGEFRIYSFFTGAQKRILIHYSLWSQTIRNMLVSKRCFRLSSNLMSLL